VLPCATSLAAAPWVGWSSFLDAAIMQCQPGAWVPERGACGVVKTLAVK
jgi:hypothetical protein